MTTCLGQLDRWSKDSHIGCVSKRRCQKGMQKRTNWVVPAVFLFIYTRYAKLRTPFGEVTPSCDSSDVQHSQRPHRVNFTNGSEWCSCTSFKMLIYSLIALLSGPLRHLLECVHRVLQDLCLQLQVNDLKSLAQGYIVMYPCPEAFLAGIWNIPTNHTDYTVTENNSIWKLWDS